MSHLGPAAREASCDSKSNISPGDHRMLDGEWTSVAVEPESAHLIAGLYLDHRLFRVLLWVYTE